VKKSLFKELGIVAVLLSCEWGWGVFAADFSVTAEVGQELGADAFDANKTMKYTVDVTNGNLYVKQTDMVIPSQRGPSIEVIRTYNSRSFDFPRMFGDANWSCSLRKYLKTDGFDVCEDPGDMEDLDVGDVLQDAPEEEDCGAYETYCHDAEDAYDACISAIATLESQTIPAIEHDIDDAEDYLDYLKDVALDDAENECDDWDDLLYDWEELESQPNWERDGSPAWMPEDDWQYYQWLGGNDGFRYDNERDNAYEFLSDVKDDIDYYEFDIILGLYDDLDDAEGALYDLENVDEPELLQDKDECCAAADDCYSFDGGTYYHVDGYVFSDGDGEGSFVPADSVAASQNMHHIEIDAADNGTVRLKDGTVYEFGGPSSGEHETAVQWIRDRYGNALSFDYQDGRLSKITDATGTRHVTIEYTPAGSVARVTDHTGRFVTYEYNAEGNLATVTYPDGGVTKYEYMEALLTKISTKVNEMGEWHSIYFKYEYDLRSDYENQWGRHIRQTKSACTEVWRDGNIGHTRYEYLFDVLGKHPGSPNEGETLITDSRDFTTGKKWKKHVVPGGGHEWMRKRFVTEIRDPYNHVTYYEWDASVPGRVGNLLRTIDTNGLVHEMEYDNLGNMTEKVEDPGGLGHTTEWEYELEYNQVSLLRDPRENTKEYLYVPAAGNAHGPKGVLWKEIDAEGFETEHWYDVHGRLTKTEDANGFVTEYSYTENTDGRAEIRNVRHSTSSYKRQIQGFGGGVWGFDSRVEYDARGNKKSEIDYNGNKIEYSYDAMNRLLKKKVCDTRTSYMTQYTYDKAGNRITMVDPKGNVTTYKYDVADRLVEVREPEGRTIKYGYDTEGNKTSETDPNGNVTTYAYDILNRLTWKSEPLGKETAYYYTGSGDSSTNGGSREYTRKKDRYTIVQQFNWDGRSSEPKILTTRYAYDRVYRLERVTDPKDGETAYEYDEVGNKIAEIDAADRETTYAYDGRNLLTRVTDPMPTPGTIEYTYDAMGNKASEEDKNGHCTYYEHGDRNLLTKVTDEFENYIEYIYDGMNKRKARDKRGYVTEFNYNVRNLLQQTILPTGGVVTVAYDDNGNKSLETDPNGNKFRYIYDGLNRMKTKTDAYNALNLTTEYSYDPVGNRTRIKDAEGRITRYNYDALNRLQLVIDAAGGATEYGYDTLGNKVLVVDARGETTRYWYDELNRLVRVRNPLRKETTYAYDEVGNRTDQWDAKGQHIEYAYDELNRLTARTFVGTGEYIEYGYDPQGNRTSMNDSRAGIDDIEYDYDELNRLTDVTYSGGKTIHYDYDENGNRTLMVDAEDGETEYDYDEMNRVVSLETSNGTTGYTYDPGGRLTQMEYPNGTWTEYGYDAANRTTTMVTRDSEDEVIQSIEYTEYDKVGNKMRMVYGTDVTSYEYDELYRLKKVTYPDDTVEEYSYDAVGNRVRKKIDGEVAERYEYNQANQLITRLVGGSGAPTREIEVTGAVSDAGDPSFSGVESVTVNGVEAEVEEGSYTAEGVVLHPGENVLTATARDRAGNESENSITVRYEPDLETYYTYSYDANGNMVQMVKTIGEQSETTEYEYDYENRMTKATLPNATTNEFVYDGDKRRVSSKNTAGAVTKFLYDGLNNLKDYASDGSTVLASYTQGIGIDKLISRTDTQGTRYYHGDALGSTRLMTKPDQTEAATYVYDAWGKVTGHTGETTNKFKFTAREFEDEIGLQYNRARFYDPETGRFITQDPLTKGPDDPTVSYQDNLYSFFKRSIKEMLEALDPYQTHRYAYCLNNPINHIDPLGLETALFVGKGIGPVPGIGSIDWLQGTKDARDGIEHISGQLEERGESTKIFLIGDTQAAAKFLSDAVSRGAKANIVTYSAGINPGISTAKILEKQNVHVSEFHSIEPSSASNLKGRGEYSIPGNVDHAANYIQKNLGGVIGVPKGNIGSPIKAVSPQTRIENRDVSQLKGPDGKPVHHLNVDEHPDVKSAIVDAIKPPSGDSNHGGEGTGNTRPPDSKSHKTASAILSTDTKDKAKDEHNEDTQ